MLKLDCRIVLEEPQFGARTSRKVSTGVIGTGDTGLKKKCRNILKLGTKKMKLIITHSLFQKFPSGVC